VVGADALLRLAIRHSPALVQVDAALVADDVELIGIAKRFGATEVLRGVSLSVPRGELLCLLGPSGCGKTTLLRILAGLIMPDEGRVLIRGADVTRTPPYERRIGLVFQNYALFPHMTVRDNVAFGLEARRVREPEVSERITRALGLLRLSGLERRYPRQLSGGQQQRVALARSLVLNPDVLLLDEPLSNLDARLRQEVREEIRGLVQELGITTVLVTHDQEEALTLADRIVVLEAGAIVQSGAPLDVYRAPRNLFVANFLGEANVLRGRIVGDAATVLVTDAGLEIALGVRPAGATRALLVLRPESIELGRERRPAANCFEGVARTVQYRGPTVEIGVDLDRGERLRVLKTLPGLDDVRPGARVWVSWPADAGVVIADEGPTR
jgi:putative spermidine/putrescine transport system ATP-binding protein